MVVVKPKVKIHFGWTLKLVANGTQCPSVAVTASHPGWNYDRHKVRKCHKRVPLETTVESSTGVTRMSGVAARMRHNDRACGRRTEGYAGPAEQTVRV